MFGKKDKIGGNEETSIVPANIRAIIQNCDTVKWMLLDPMANKEDSTIKVLEGAGEILREETDTAAESRMQLVATLVSPYSFEKDSVLKNCTFLPDIAIEFIKNDSNAMVSYSFYCDVCRFSQGESYVDFNGETVRDDILRMALGQFPKDRYLRKLAKISR